MGKQPTHILTRDTVAVPNSDTPMQTAHLYRSENGLRIATAKDALVQFGEDPQQGHMRVFIDHSYAISFLRKLADRDWAVESGVDPRQEDFLKIVASGYSANIEEHDSQSRIVLAHSLASAAVRKQ